MAIGLRAFLMGLGLCLFPNCVAGEGYRVCNMGRACLSWPGSQDLCRLQAISYIHDPVLHEGSLCLEGTVSISFTRLPLSGSLGERANVPLVFVCLRTVSSRTAVN